MVPYGNYGTERVKITCHLLGYDICASDDVVATANTGYIVSPGYRRFGDGRYDSDLLCELTLQASAGMVSHLRWS